MMKNENGISVPTCPLEDYWKSRADMYPRVYRLAKKYLSLVVNSVPCERLFSKLGMVISKRRCNLTSNKVSLIGFIAGNAHLANELNL